MHRRNYNLHRFAVDKPCRLLHIISIGPQSYPTRELNKQHCFYLKGQNEGSRKRNYTSTVKLRIRGRATTQMQKAKIHFLQLHYVPPLALRRANYLMQKAGQGVNAF